jgi:hypothetical protein
MLNKEDYILTEVLGKDDPQVRALVAAASNPGMEGAVHEMLRSLARQRGWNPDDPPRFALPQGISPSDFVIGTAMSGDVVGEEVGLAEGDLSSHCGVFGTTSSGKTTLVKVLIHAFKEKEKTITGEKLTSLVLDMGDEYRDMLPLYAPGELIWMTADELGLNIFEVPRGEDGKPVMLPDKWLNNVRELMRLAWLNEPSLNLLCEILREEYARRGVLTGSDDYSSLSDVIEVLRLLSPRPNSDRARARDKLLDRLESLRAMLPGLDVKRSRDFRKLMDRSIILDVSDVRDVALPLLFAFLVTLLREVYRSESVRGIKRMLVMEEAHAYMSGATDKRTSDLKESTPSGVLRDLRKSGGGTCGVVVSHLIHDVSPSVRGNLGSVISLKQGNRESVRQAAGSLNLKPWQEDEIAKLPNRHAIARFSRYGDPVYFAVKDACALGLGVSPTPSREEARERSRPILEAIPYVKGEEAPQRLALEGGGKEAGSEAVKEGELRPREKRVFARICERPWELIDDRKDALGLDRESEGAARDTLGTRNLIGFAGIVGAKNRLVDLTARGFAVAAVWGLTVAKRGKGSVVHQAIVEYTQQSLERYSPLFRYQRIGISSTTLGVQPDLLVLTMSGGRVPVQACYRNQPKDEAEKLMKLHDLALLDVGDPDKVDCVLAVASNRRHKAAVEKALREKNGGKMPARMVMLDFDMIVHPAFDWTLFINFPV